MCEKSQINKTTLNKIQKDYQTRTERKVLNLDKVRNLNHSNRSSNKGEWALGRFEIIRSGGGSPTWSKEVRLVGRRFNDLVERGSTGRKEVQ